MCFRCCWYWFRNEIAFWYIISHKLRKKQQYSCFHNGCRRWKYSHTNRHTISNVFFLLNIIIRVKLCQCHKNKVTEPHYIDVMRAMASKSPTSQLFAQTFVHAQINENIKGPRHWPCEGNPPVTDGFPSERTSNAANVFIWWRHHEYTQQTSNTWRHYM